MRLTLSEIYDAEKRELENPVGSMSREKRERKVRLIFFASQLLKSFEE